VRRQRESQPPARRRVGAVAIAVAAIIGHLARRTNERSSIASLGTT
jgi:hypothetical protein